VIEAQWVLVTGGLGLRAIAKGIVSFANAVAFEACGCSAPRRAAIIVRLTHVSHDNLS
jgi:hypothetical protein